MGQLYACGESLRDIEFGHVVLYDRNKLSKLRRCASQVSFRLTRFCNFDQISQFWPNFTIATKFHNFDQISQFWPNFTIPTKFHNLVNLLQFGEIIGHRGWLIGPKLFRRHEAYPACASAKSFANSFLKPNSDCNDDLLLSLDRCSWNIINENGFVEDMINIKAW